MFLFSAASEKLLNKTQGYLVNKEDYKNFNNSVITIHLAALFIFCTEKGWESGGKNKIFKCKCWN